MESDRELIPYVRAFERAAKVSINYPVYFVKKLGGEAVGRCTYVFSGSIRIGLRVEIQKKDWDAMPESYRKLLMFHELGHCSLGLNHDIQYKNGCPASGMNDRLPSYWCMEQVGLNHYLKSIIGDK
jgi:hypothetical protein